MKKYVWITLFVSTLAIASNSTGPACNDIVIPGKCHGEMYLDPDFLWCWVNMHGSQSTVRCPPGCAKVGYDDSAAFCTGNTVGAACNVTVQCVPKWITELPF